MDRSTSMGIDKSVRIRVEVDVRKPLLQSVKLKMKNGMEEFFDIKYEKPPFFCIRYGLIGHGTKDCQEYREEEEPTLK
ncbi:50S ribosomal protein L23 chloroplastic [Bienertia sinuspersici]